MPPIPVVLVTISPRLTDPADEALPRRVGQRLIVYPAAYLRTNSGRPSPSAMPYR